MRLVIFISVILFSCTEHTQNPPMVTFNPLSSGSTSGFRGLDVVSDDVAWVAGANGQVGRTIDAGKTWTIDTVPGTAKLQFRDIHGFSAQAAVAMTIGSNTDSRVYRTTDGGQSWTMTHQNTIPAAFYCAVEFWDDQRGIIMSDPVGSKLHVLTTMDGGITWTVVDSMKLPPIIKGEYGFAASGTNLTVAENGLAFIATGGSAARVFRSEDYGQTWTVHDTPMMVGKASTGLFSVQFRDGMNGVAVGGDYARADSMVVNLVRTTDGGKTWTAEHVNKIGYRSCVRYVGSGDDIITVGRKGYSLIRGTVLVTDTLSNGFYAVDVSPTGQTIIASGAQGRIAKIIVN